MNNRKRKARCHTPDKVVFRYQSEAERAATDAASNYGRAMQAYQCDSCGRWHITRVKR